MQVSTKPITNGTATVERSNYRLNDKTRRAKVLHTHPTQKETFMAYCIMRIEKRKRSALYGLQIEANRTSEDLKKGRDFSASDINWDFTDFNIFLVKADNWGKAVTKALEEAQVQERKNSVVVLEGFYGASHEWFVDKSLEEIVSYFKDCLAYHEKTYGKVINAVIHFDEATPHLSVISPSILQSEDGQNRLSARDIMGGRADYRRRQDEFYEQVGKPRGMERGESQDPENIREHLSVQEFKKQTNHLQIEQLEMLKAELHKECRKLIFYNKKLQEMNSALSEQVERPFLQYCMMEFIRKAKVRGESGEVKHIIDGFNSYMGRNEAELRASWQAQFEAQEIEPISDLDETFEKEHEHEYDYDDIERG